MKKITVIIIATLIMILMTACKNTNEIPYESRADISYAIDAESNILSNQNK